MLRDLDSLTLSATDESLRAPERQPHLFLVLRSHEPLAPPARISLKDVDELVIGRGSSFALAQAPKKGVQKLSLSVPDPQMSAPHARICRVLGRHVLEDREGSTSSKNGCFVNGERTSKEELSDGDVLEMGHTFFVFREGIPEEREGSPLVDATQLSAPAPGLGSFLPALQSLFEQLGRVARSDISVILAGETGTGKEVLARAIHAISGRPGHFVAVNCGALPDDLVEAELFGYRRGAFSGAVEDRTGLLKSADGGTLLLDEIGDMPLRAQAVLLRALQEREVRPVGATRSVGVDLRVIAATHRDLDNMVAAGQFREDLLRRLSGHRVAVPPLRDRMEDLGLLVAAILRRARPGSAESVKISRRAMRLLLDHEWPGNIRELEKVLTTALVLAGDKGVVNDSHLPDALARAVDGAVKEAAWKKLVVSLLTKHQGNISAIAREQGKQRVQIQRWLKKLSLDADKFRPGARGRTGP